MAYSGAVVNDFMKNLKLKVGTKIVEFSKRKQNC